MSLLDSPYAWIVGGVVAVVGVVVLLLFGLSPKGQSASSGNPPSETGQPTNDKPNNTKTPVQQGILDMIAQQMAQFGTGWITGEQSHALEIDNKRPRITVQVDATTGQPVIPYPPSEINGLGYNLNGVEYRTSDNWRPYITKDDPWGWNNFVEQRLKPVTYAANGQGQGDVIVSSLPILVYEWVTPIGIYPEGSPNTEPPTESYPSNAGTGGAQVINAPTGATPSQGGYNDSSNTVCEMINGNMQCHNK